MFDITEETGMRIGWPIWGLHDRAPSGATLDQAGAREGWPSRVAR
jgi:hypothetical protein